MEFWNKTRKGSALIHGYKSPYLQVCAVHLQKRGGEIQKSVCGEYCLRTDLGARWNDVACLVHAYRYLRSSCVWTTDLPQDGWRPSPVRQRAHNALSPRVLF